MAPSLSLQPEIRWSSPALAFFEDGSVRRTTLFEAIYDALSEPYGSEFRVECPSGSYALGAGEILATCGRSRPSSARPEHGDEANALVLDREMDEPIPEPIFRGRWDVACRRIWRLPPHWRALGFVVSHDTIYNPAWLEERRPAPAGRRLSNQIRSA